MARSSYLSLSGSILSGSIDHSYPRIRRFPASRAILVALFVFGASFYAVYYTTKLLPRYSSDKERSSVQLTPALVCSLLKFAQANANAFSKGWNSWNVFACDINETLFLTMAQASLLFLFLHIVIKK